MDVLFENSVQACYVYNHDDDDDDDDDNSHDDNNGDGDDIMMDYSDISDDMMIIINVSYSSSHLVFFYHPTAHIGMDLPIHLLEHYRLQFSCVG